MADAARSRCDKKGRELESRLGVEVVSVKSGVLSPAETKISGDCSWLSGVGLNPSL